MPRHTRRHARRKSTVRRRRASRTSKALRRRVMRGGKYPDYVIPDLYRSGLTQLGKTEFNKRLPNIISKATEEYQREIKSGNSPGLWDRIVSKHMNLAIEELLPRYSKNIPLSAFQQKKQNAEVNAFAAKIAAKRAAQNAALERYIAYSRPAKGAFKPNNGSAAAGAGAGAGAVAAPVAKTAKNIAKSTSNALFALNAERRRAAPVAINPDDVSKSLERLTIEFSDLMAYGEKLVNDGHNSQAAELEPYAMRIDAALKAAEDAMAAGDVYTAFQQVSQASTAMGGASVVAASFHKNLS
jgi:hypothetical protein